MDFKNANELLALCQQEGCSISEIMRRRECALGETTVEAVTQRMTRVLEIWSIRSGPWAGSSAARQSV